jgi:peptide deformylase
MAQLAILEYPDPRLRTKAQPVTVFDAALKQQVADMFETMYAAPGIGLAATQVNVHQRLLVIDVSEDKNQPLVLINPEILGARGRGQRRGGLPVGARHLRRRRARRAGARARAGRGWRAVEHRGRRLLAVCIQHEMDHLDGKLFVDYLSELKRQRIRKKLDKERRERGSARAGSGQQKRQ